MTVRAQRIGDGLFRLAASLVLVLALAAAAGAVRAQTPGIFADWPTDALERLSAPATLAQGLADGRQVRVIVELRVTGPAGPAGQGDDAESAQVRRAQDAVLGRVLGVGAAAGADADSALSLRRMTFSPMMALFVDAGLLRRLAEDPGVVRIVPDEMNRPALTTTLGLLGMPTVYNAGFTGQGQAVAILDTGGYRPHEFLNPRIAAASCFSTHNPAQGIYSLCPGNATSSTALDSANDCRADLISGCGHGTHVAGTAAGFVSSPSAGMPPNGVARNTQIISINVFTVIDAQTGQCGDLEQGLIGCVTAFTSDIIAGLERVYALRNTYTIAAVNMSIQGGRHSSHCTGDEARTAVQRLHNAGIAVIAAAGNSGWDRDVAWPACIPEAIAVGNSTNHDSRSPSSNWGPLIDIVAPGTEILASYISRTNPPQSNYYARLTGTSMSAPHVTGAFAVLRSAAPTASVADILAAMRDTGVNVTSAGVTQPRMDVAAALQQLTGTGAPPNNRWVNRTNIPSPRTVTGTLDGATAEAGQPELLHVVNRRTVWWRYTPPVSGQVTVETCGSNFDTVLGVYTGSSLASLTLVGANDDACEFQSRVVFQGTAGTSYSIAVAAYAAHVTTGTVSLTVRQPNAAVLATTTTLTGPANVNHGASASYSATVRATGGGTPTGTVSFRRGGTQFATATLNGQGIATAASTAFPPGQHQITAVYLGTTGFQTSTSAAVGTRVTASTTTTLAGPTTGQTGQNLTFTATVRSGAGSPNGTVSFRRGGTQFATGAVNASGQATGTGSFPAGTHQITAHYLGVTGYGTSASAARSVTVTQPTVTLVEFRGGGTVFNLNTACVGGGWANTAHPVRLAYSPGELNGNPTQVSLLWPSGAEHLAVWQPLSATTANFEALGRQMWSFFVLQTNRPRLTPVQRVIMQPAGGSNMAQAQQVMLRVRVVNFGGIDGCSATVAGTLRRTNG